MDEPCKAGTPVQVCQSTRYVTRVPAHGAVEGVCGRSTWFSELGALLAMSRLRRAVQRERELCVDGNRASGHVHSTGCILLAMSCLRRAGRGEARLMMCCYHPLLENEAEQYRTGTAVATIGSACWQQPSGWPGWRTAELLQPLLLRQYDITQTGSAVALQPAGRLLSSILGC